MQLKVAGLGLLQDRPTPKLEAYLKILKGIEHVYRWTKNDNALARKLYEEAIALDPDYGSAYRLLGWTHHHDAAFGWGDSPGKSLDKAEELAQKALSLGDEMVYHLFSSIYMHKGEFDKAIAVGEKGLALNSNNANYNAYFSRILSMFGRNQEAIVMMKKAMRLNPHHPTWYLYFLGVIHAGAGRYEEAIATFEQLLVRGGFPPIAIHERLAINYARLDRMEEARAHAAEILEIKPDYTVELFRKTTPYKDQAYLESLVDLLRKAGLPG